jgi:hypothetical protein
MSDEYISIKAACKLAGVSQGTLYLEIDRGNLKALKATVGLNKYRRTQYRILRSDFEVWVNSYRLTRPSTNAAGVCVFCGKACSTAVTSCDTCPSQEIIAKGTAEARAEWDAVTELGRRASGKPVEFTLPRFIPRTRRERDIVHNLSREATG